MTVLKVPTQGFRSDCRQLGHNTVFGVTSGWPVNRPVPRNSPSRRSIRALEIWHQSRNSTCDMGVIGTDQIEWRRSCICELMAFTSGKQDIAESLGDQILKQSYSPELELANYICKATSPLDIPHPSRPHRRGRVFRTRLAPSLSSHSIPKRLKAGIASPSGPLRVRCDRNEKWRVGLVGSIEQ
jgi:hypothetical protein